MGRPSLYSKELAEIICDRLSQGESLVSICKEKGIPSTVTVFKWLGDKDNKEFANMYACAREAQAEFYANQIIDISDETPISSSVDETGAESTRVDAAGVQRNKLRVDSRKWIAARLLPRKYGERQQIEHSGKVTLEGLVCGDEVGDEE